ncbi:MAG: hypothetical protein H0X68_10425 [Chloroflexi bacterium]|nr:hypothetical protein [Chloroflexota bacterium]
MAREIARRKADWDSIVVPETRAIDLVRGEFDYSDEVLVLGPNDDLATSRAVDVFLAASPPN